MRASFLMDCFDYLRGTLSVTFYLTVSAKDVTMPSNGTTTVGHLVLDNSAKLLFLDGRHCLEAMRLMQVVANVRCIQHHVVFRLIVREDEIEISEAEVIKPSKIQRT